MTNRSVWIGVALAALLGVACGGVAEAPSERDAGFDAREPEPICESDSPCMAEVCFYDFGSCCSAPVDPHCVEGAPGVWCCP